MLTCENPTYMRLVYSKMPANRFLAKIKTAQIENPLHINLGQFRFWIASTLDTGAVPFLIRPILLNGSPLKIAELIIRPVSVQMPGLKALRARALESLQYQPMHQSRMLYAVSSKPNKVIPRPVNIVFKDALSTHGPLKIPPRQAFNPAAI